MDAQNFTDNKEIIDRIIRVLSIIDDDFNVNRTLKSHYNPSSILLQTMSDFYSTLGVSTFLNGYTPMPTKKLLSLEGALQVFLQPSMQKKIIQI